MALNKFFLAFLVRFLWFLRFLQILELWVTVYCKYNNVIISFVGIIFLKSYVSVRDASENTFCVPLQKDCNGAARRRFRCLQEVKCIYADTPKLLQSIINFLPFNSAQGNIMLHKRDKLRSLYLVDN
jgi:hypothetical protein